MDKIKTTKLNKNRTQRRIGFAESLGRYFYRICQINEEDFIMDPKADEEDKKISFNVLMTNYDELESYERHMYEVAGLSCLNTACSLFNILLHENYAHY